MRTAAGPETLRAVLELLAGLEPSARDAAVDAWLGLGAPPPSSSPGPELIGLHEASVAAVVRALVEAPVGPGDVFVDLGAGRGRVALLARALTGATVRGVELQPALVSTARAAAQRVGLEASFVEGDVRDAPLDDGTVFFLYAPFTGRVLAEVVDRLRAVARRHAIVVCAHGVDLQQVAPWLIARRTDSFWLTLYDGGGPPRESPAPGDGAAWRIALER